MKAELEAYLRAEKRWFSTGELVNRFGVTERALRAVGNVPGLCTEFAISSNAGFKHVEHATDAEFDRFYDRSRTHSIRQLVRLRRLARRRKSYVAKPTPPQTREGQLLIELPGFNQPTNADRS